MTAPDAPETDSKPSPLRTRVITAHLLFTLGFLACFFLFMGQVWYPPPLFDSQGVQGVLNVFAVVFCAVGPLLTAILYIPGKKGLWLDMMVVTLLQLGALGVGGELLYAERPLYLAFTIDRFIAIPASTLVQPERLRWPELAPGLLDAPRTVFVTPPSDKQEATRLMFEVMGGKGRDMEHRPQYYESLAPHLAEVLAMAVDLELLAQRQPDKFPRVREALAAWGQDRDTVAFLPLFGKEKQPMLIGVRKADGRILGGVRIDPWVGGGPRKSAAKDETSPPSADSAQKGSTAHGGR